MNLPKKSTIFLKNDTLFYGVKSKISYFVIRTVSGTGKFEQDKMNILLAGATGLTGKYLLERLVNDQRVNNIHLLLRRKPGLRSSKITKHFTDLDDLENLTVEDKIDVVISCLGTTQKKSGKKGLYKVDHDYVVGLAKWAAKNNAGKFIMVSSVGANIKSRLSYYLKVKGEAEEDVKKLGIPSVIIFRPSLLLGPRDEYRPAEVFGEKVLNFFRPLLRAFWKNQVPVEAADVAGAILHQGFEKGEGVKILHTPEIVNSE